MKCDLHIHSTFSDGTCTPAEIIAMAKERSLIVALTDHNTIAGLPEFLHEAVTMGVTAVPGVELTTSHGGKELHLLGLFIPEESFPAVTEFTHEYHEKKEKSNTDLIARLAAAGYDIDYDTLKRENPNGNINRAHVAKFLLKKGYVGSTNEAFDTLLCEDGPFYIPAKHTDTLDAIRFLCKINALPVLAHPLEELDENELRALLPKAAEAGLVGMETCHSSYDENRTVLAKKIADEFSLLHSGGSDFHGAVKPDVALGTGTGLLDIPESVYYALLAKHNFF